MSTAPNNRSPADLEVEVNAMARGLHAVDVGRRVGWARAYAAEASKEELSRENNMLRSDRTVIARATAYLYGYVMAYAELKGDQVIVQAAMGKWSKQILSIFDEDQLRAGREAAELHEGLSEARRARKDARDAQRSENTRIYDRGFKSGRDQERNKLMRRYGFHNEAELHNYLSLYSPTTGGTP